MKTGRTLTDLAREIHRQTETKKDFVADTRKLSMEQAAEGRLRIRLEGIDAFDITTHAHDQLATSIKIPRQYYDRMAAEAPQLLLNNVNHWLAANPQQRMVRTLDGSMRAMLSDRYRPLDNFDLLGAALPVIQQHGASIMSCETTDTRMYLKVVMPKIETEVKRGDVVQAGLVISNSEIGAGALKVEPFIYRLVCLNGMTMQSALRRYHVGKKNQSLDDTVMEVLSDRTRQLTDAAFWHQVRDVVSSAFSKDIFEENVQRLRDASEQKLTGNPAKAVEEITERFSLPSGLGGDILRNLIEGADLTRWGIANAVTAVANDYPDYETASELERVGGQIIELAASDWKSIAEAV